MTESNGIEAGIEAGIAKERERVLAHLEMAERTGNMKIAIKAIRDGLPMTQTLMAEYMASCMKSKTKAKTRSLMDQGLDILAARRGLSVIAGGGSNAQGDDHGDGGLVA